MTIVESESVTHHKKLTDLQKQFVSHIRQMDKQQICNCY